MTSGTSGLTGRLRRIVAPLDIGGKILLGLALVMLLASLASLIDTNSGTIRMLDMLIEIQIYISAAVAMLAVLFARPRSLLVIGICLATIAFNLTRIWPYTALAPAQVALPADVEGMSCAGVLSFNVLQDNEDYARTAELIESIDPDILLLMETNNAWVKALEPQLAAYHFRLQEPLENTYGMVFATRLGVDRAEMVFDFGEKTPTLYATLRAGDGRRFELIGLHPKPPLPGESTAVRDAKIARAGANTPDSLDHVVAIGDFNDVPWSDTTRGFVADGNYLDPRAGRGAFATFPANYKWLGWPLDQLFVKEGIKVARFEIGEDVGSDHLPLIADVCFDPR